MEKVTERKPAAIHNSLRGLYLALPFSLRSIANSKTGVKRWRYQREVSRDRHARPIGEVNLNISALERLLAEDLVNPRGRRYKAANLAQVVDSIRRAYEHKPDGEGQPASAHELTVVDWNGGSITNRCRRAEYLRQLLAKKLRRTDRIRAAAAFWERSKLVGAEALRPPSSGGRRTLARQSLPSRSMRG